MSITPLTPRQQSAVDALVTTGRLRSVPPDALRAADFLAVADERLAELPTMQSAVVRHGVAYDAAHDVGEAFLAAHGYGTISGPGQHAAIGDFLAIVIDVPPEHARAVRSFDRARRARNQQNYRANPVGEAQATDVESIARALRSAAQALGVGT
jgi:hypothetical protein